MAQLRDQLIHFYVPSLSPHIAWRQVPLGTWTTHRPSDKARDVSCLSLHGEALPMAAGMALSFHLPFALPGYAGLPALRGSDLLPAPGPLHLLSPLPGVLSPHAFPGSALPHHPASVTTGSPPSPSLALSDPQHRVNVCAFLVVTASKGEALANLCSAVSPAPTPPEPLPRNRRELRTGSAFLFTAGSQWPAQGGPGRAQGGAEICLPCTCSTHRGERCAEAFLGHLILESAACPRLGSCGNRPLRLRRPWGRKGSEQREGPWPGAWGQVWVSCAL